MAKRAMMMLPALVLTISAAAPQAQAPRDTVSWARTWDEAKLEAQERNVPIFFTIQQDDNPGCQQMENAFRDNAFIQASKKVVCVVSNPDTRHGIRDVYINKVKTPMCKAYDGIICEVHTACQRAIDAFFKEGNFEIPTQVWAKPDGTELFKITGSGGNGAGTQTSPDLIRDLDKALNRIGGLHMTRREWEEVKKSLADGDMAEGKQEWKTALAIFKKVKESKWEKFAKQASDKYDAVVNSGVRLVDKAKKSYEKTDDPKKKKELKEMIQKIAKEMKGTPAGDAAEKVLKDLK